MKKCLFLFLMVFLIGHKVWSKPILEIASFQDGESSEGRFSAMNVDNSVFGFIDHDLKKYLKKAYPQSTNIETQLYVDDKGFVVVGESESIPAWILARIGKNDLLVNGDLFVNGSIHNSDDLKAEISTLKDEITDLKSEIVKIMTEIKALRK